MDVIKGGFFGGIIGLIIGFIYTALVFIWGRIEFLSDILLFLYKTVFWPVHFMSYVFMAYIAGFWLNVVMILVFGVYLMIIGGLIGWVMSKITTPSKVEL